MTPRESSVTVGVSASFAHALAANDADTTGRLRVRPGQEVPGVGGFVRLFRGSHKGGLCSRSRREPGRPLWIAAQARVERRWGVSSCSSPRLLSAQARRLLSAPPPLRRSPRRRRISECGSYLRISGDICVPVFTNMSMSLYLQRYLSNCISGDICVPVSGSGDIYAPIIPMLLYLQRFLRKCISGYI